ncbi:SH2 domain-containing protein 2A [Bombina bombina]|uniref:SH2 domain-containing protein 2A n=1 Tax=Bombina bombina TaxID=8345 RepID=UPI00235ACA27|nr:SH2 domain-containing protein 2A [Bombina bombina]
MDSEYLQGIQPVLFTTFRPPPIIKNETQSTLTLSNVGSQDSVAQAGNEDNQSMAVTKKFVSTLKEQTEKWFDKTQRKRLLKQGEYPDWFHGFITRRRAEEMLQEKPLGTYLIRFCESRVGLVLSYRGAERCRHFMIDHLPAGNYVIEGESSTHSQLQDLLEHYCKYPLDPYKEILTVACTKISKNKDFGNSPDAAKDKQANSTIHKETGTSGDTSPLTSTSPKELKSISSELKLQAQHGLPSDLTKIPQVLEKGPIKCLAREDQNVSYAFVKKTPGAAISTKAERSSSDQKYSTFQALHTYAEPESCHKLEPNIFTFKNKLEESIAFYAMGRGSCKDNVENVYSEVDTKCAGTYGFNPTASREVVSTTLPHSLNKTVKTESSTLHSSFRFYKKPTSPSDDHFMRWDCSGKPANNSECSQKTMVMHLDGLAYGNNMEDMENIYEKIPEDCAFKPRNNRSTKH